MRIIGVTMVSNEADVIEAFVRHNLRFLDGLVVLDHASVDRTGAIVTSLAVEGLPLVLLRDADRAFRQGERITMMASRYLAEMDASWCFALDADEFVACASRAELEAALARVAPGVHGLVPLANYVGIGGAPEELHVLRRVTRRLRVERAAQRKVVIRRGFEALPAGQVSLGNHAVLQVVKGKVIPLPHVPLEGVRLAHFPVRSPQQVAQKALIGWLGTRLTRPERFMRPGQVTPASHWKALFERLQRGDAVDEAFARAAIEAYVGGPVADADLVEDPLATDGTLRYGAEKRATALAGFALWTDSVFTEWLARDAANPGRGPGRS